jgi:AdoMet-dependent rRNA methyltransferase SPB1
MGKKVKTGKFRKDKFYELAKESGYRARSAFKLLQLNRIYHFLEKSRVCIDLCAAPGGWLQVAATHMPMSSVIIGVDLVSIKSIANVITHKEDITTEKCRSTLKKDLNDRKADVVLHDGAPNVGKNWLNDAYQQNLLVLQSFKLASEFLVKGGTFVTKVFRSKDYYSLMWVFQQFFKKVDSTKPQASRNESAEIFVICQNYKGPEKIDPKFFDLKYVFSDVENQNEMRSANDLFNDSINKRHRGGYPDGDLTLYKKLKVSDFIEKENYLELLANSNEIILDINEVAKHSDTTIEIKECIKDIRLLGKNDIKNVIKWRNKMKSFVDGKKKSDYQNGAVNTNESSSVSKKTNLKTDMKNGVCVTDLSNEKKTTNDGVDDGDGEEDNSDNQLEDELKEAVTEEMRAEKKKKRKLLKEKQKIKERQKLRMDVKNDTTDFDLQGDNEMFSLNKIKTKQQLIELSKVVPNIGMNMSDNEDDEQPFRRGKKKISFLKSDQNRGFDDDDEEYSKRRDDDTGFSSDEEIRPDNEDDQGSDFEIETEDEIEDNPLLVDLVSRNEAHKKEINADKWFSKVN